MPEGGFDMYAAAIAKKALRIRLRFLWREMGKTKSQIPLRRMELGSCPGLRGGIRRRI